jgi:hypothetical protein
MAMRTRILAVGLAVVSTALPAYAGPKVVVKLQHPAMTEWRLGTVAFHPPQGECATQVMESVTQTLAKHQISAGPVDLRTRLYEHKVALPAFLGSADVQSLGKHIDADTLLVVRLSRCTYPERKIGWEHPKDWLGFEDKKVIEYWVTVRSSISGTLQAVDLKSGRITKALPLDAVPVVTQRSRDSYPEGASVDEVQRQAVAMFAAQIERVFLPWTEEREVVFFDDKDCDLKVAAGLMKTGDVKSALAQSRRNVETCRANPKAKDKHRRHALHNLATALLASGEAGEALPLFEEALRLGGDEEQKQGVEASSALVKLKGEAGQVEPKIAAATLTGS